MSKQQAKQLNDLKQKLQATRSYQSDAKSQFWVTFGIRFIVYIEHPVIAIMAYAELQCVVRIWERFGLDDKNGSFITQIFGYGIRFEE
ncbi:MAG: hypothetical protein EZS28_053950 [Streblomastix strix]|uniref:Uncharacterized protein n=1 Tax=Streblomastix strix TaxID=222440 RepID=A0A5J4QYQ9_9EUKA|nr:MAG: hypothetical protein EZS28_053950 [Streblomastix strix]